jgi:uncharacterized protein
VRHDAAQLDGIIAPIAAWACSRSDVVGLALVGSWANGSAREDSDIDLVLLVQEPRVFRHDTEWLDAIDWSEGRVAGWSDTDYGGAWSRHVRLVLAREIEFTFCAPSWACTDPLDAGTAEVVSKGCRPIMDDARLFQKLIAVVER